MDDTVPQWAPLLLTMSLQKSGTVSQVLELLGRLPGAGRFYTFTQISRQSERFRCGFSSVTDNIDAPETHPDEWRNEARVQPGRDRR